MSGEKAMDYQVVMEEIVSITAGETDRIANLGNIASILHERLGFLWTGFYRVVGDELVLGPFQGSTACIRIARGRGVCGTSWDRDEVLVVPDVHKFEGHIACDSRSRSEIVLPLHMSDGEIWGVLDIDSERVGDFDENDAAQLIDVIEVVEEILGRSD